MFPFAVWGFEVCWLLEGLQKRVLPAMCFINFAPCCRPFEWLWFVYIVPVMSPGIDQDALQLSDDYNYPQLESNHVSKDDKFQRSEKMVHDAKSTASCLMYFNCLIAMITMVCAMFSFGKAAMDNDVDGCFIAFYIMVFCFFLLVFEARRLILPGKAMTEEAQRNEEKILASGIIDEFKLNQYKFYTRHRYDENNLLPSAHNFPHASLAIQIPFWFHVRFQPPCDLHVFVS